MCVGGMIREIQTSNKTKEEKAEGGPLRVSKPIREVETDVADSGAQLGSVSNFWLVILPIII